MNERLTRPVAGPDPQTRLDPRPALYSIPVDIAPWLERAAEAHHPDAPPTA
ncbi:hypothetical protein M2390_002384 [Mycetocola sp. BIGb0189]|uniref:hypothetical protein n=1 Tax=Mycetocola sp. BIGb0189 TaxID=2940604 RepID=UPI0021692B5D|nr:hypothetical protein [Mycetocola sp. BIGb0189]MCS4277180.1 hypothetical protein [Mycetocola sp. BIGb0189]